MRNTEGQTGPYRSLYPVIQPYAHHTLEVGHGHKIYVEECGNPQGIPVVVLHGGPGGGCSPGMRRFFHPDLYRIILFDQRGCGRSTPHSSVEHNTTWDLVADIERIRTLLDVDQWIVFGGSWGATLALIYAETHPRQVRHLVLRGVFLMTERELDWFYNGGAGQFFPTEWRQMTDLLEPEERGSVIGAFHRRLFGNDERVQTRFARAWTEWESALATLEQRRVTGSVPAAYARAFARIENHYFHNKGFLEEDGQILRDIHKIADIPGCIVHGRYDMICPPRSAYMLHEAWPSSTLNMIPTSGHSLSEVGICSALVTIMDDLA
ncbi:proline iminopeptidase [Amylibacter marinus]|uniref:Proline iminopeptidase n=1 Tax=Amylibacter marinus TaxID=1475483 RepID=A0ABQ5VW40_9RHOB|nr:prolyl aminopeptidase [Amylibacter marinus]GLQ35565.1 proline iminopeptidase [Amylibacter marinus]